MALEVVKPRICWGGVKARGSRRLECGESVNDPGVIEEVMRLINEFLNRVEKHKSILLSDSATPFDETIKALSSWLQEIKSKIEENNDETITNLRKAMHDIGEKMLRLAERAREKWLKTYKRELEELIEKLRKGEANVAVSGDPFDNSKSFAVHLYTENLTIEVARMAKSGSTTIEIIFTGLKGTHIAVPKQFGENKLRAMQCGLLMTDGSINKKGYPEMNTNQIWQVVIWPIIWFRGNLVYINGVSLNDGDLSVRWHLRAIDHRDAFKSKAEVAEEAGKLNNEDFLSFSLFAILGDGSVDVKRKSIILTMGKAKRELWGGGGVIERLEGLGFRKNDERHIINYVAKASRAVELTRRWLDDALIKALVEDLSSLPDAEKLRRLITLANTKIKPKVRSSIEVVGIKMNVHVNNNGTVELRVKRKDYGDAEAVREALKRAGYNVKLWGHNGRFEVYIRYGELKRHPELMAKVCEVLRRMHEEAMSENNIKRAQRIAKAMMNLKCQDPAQSPRAQ